MSKEEMLKHAEKVVKWLRENENPYTKVIIDFDGTKIIVVNEFIPSKDV